MTRRKEDVQRADEFQELFISLNERSQEAALTILRSLGFAQSVMYSQKAEKQRNPAKQPV